jgi:succinyl-CoA synthetase alpha subunit
MDLLEYQGKQLFAKHGVPVPYGRPATTVQEAVEAAEELGYPVVVKAQVQIGGRGKAGGIKLSRSGTLTYQIGNELAQRGFGNSSIVGIGGDPVPGSSFIDMIELFEADTETELIVMCGEIGGSAEEEAAEYIAENVSKPVLAYIAGFTAPPGKTMGHAGAIVSGSKGTAVAKAEALEAKGVRVGRNPTQVSELAVEILGTRV